MLFRSLGLHGVLVIAHHQIKKVDLLLQNTFIIIQTALLQQYIQQFMNIKPVAVVQVNLVFVVVELSVAVAVDIIQRLTH